MIDTEAFNLLHPDGHAHTSNDALAIDAETATESNEDFLVQLPSWIHGFNITNKTWGKFQFQWFQLPAFVVG
jgi:hypothetical protein